MSRSSGIALSLIVPLALLCGTDGARAQEQTVRVGMVRALSSTATMIAIEKGYFKDYGIKVVIEDIDSSIDALAVVAQNRPQVVDQGLGFAFADPDDFITPGPMTIAVSFVNTDWTAKNPDLAKNFFLAAMRGARDYCQAYHGAPNRSEVVDIAIRTGVEPRREMIDKYPWAARSPDGRVNVDSMLDIQRFFVQEGLSLKEFPAQRLLTSTDSDYAVAP